MYRGNLCSLESYRHIPYPLIELIQVVKRKIQSNSNVGTYSVIGDDVFYFIVDDKTKHFSETKSEIHQRYIDVQIVMEGEEMYGYSQSPFNSIDEDFIADKDVAFSKDIVDEQFATLYKDDFIIFNTEQPHRPLVATSEPASVKKAVIKVSKEYLINDAEV
ncbi:YhcH/YjgK/YiaL family protein (plasmid) [Photobacterium sp. DA100]|uniref:YhcH/YjgK/YiaL family protein n=1 Tax=Photobacterium sp. DA100 TaxID=3027472 RepID=UPI002478A3CA|nr:YhcH/YjgK/YiaL family protein [Photobacterium sp. DA100]WEM45415.1 YhcH/YjgK/YiaL family protein [Photobacterium sp. DA100]